MKKYIWPIYLLCLVLFCVSLASADITTPTIGGKISGPLKQRQLPQPQWAAQIVTDMGKNQTFR